MKEPVWMKIRCCGSTDAKRNMEFEITIGRCPVCEEKNVLLLGAGTGDDNCDLAYICENCIKRNIEIFHENEKELI